MLPVTLQIPAAVLLVLGGAVACFAGYRFFRIVLGLYGFVLGALLATTVAGAGSTSSLLIWAVVGGLAGALVLNLAYFFGVVLVGAAVGAMAVTLLWSRASGDPHVLIVVAFAVVGALAAMWLQRYVVVTGTAFGGAWTLLVGALALMGDAAAQAARRHRRVGCVSARSRAGPSLVAGRLAGARRWPGCSSSCARPVHGSRRSSRTRS